jgi:hypothetical protein
MDRVASQSLQTEAREYLGLGRKRLRMIFRDGPVLREVEDEELRA